MENTKEEVKLPKHLQAAVNQLQKQVDKFNDQRKKELFKQATAGFIIQELDDSISALSEQIKKLKGQE